MAKATKNETTEIAKTETTAVAAYDYGDDAVPIGQVPKGYEGQTNEDIAIPFIKLLQPNSPQVAGQLIAGISGGMYFNTVTQQLWKNPGGLLFVLAATRHEYLRWRPESRGSGFVGRYSIEDPIVAKAKQASKEFGTYYVDTEDGHIGEDGDELSETFTAYGLACDEEGNFGMAIFPFKSTGIKTYKNWMTQIRSHTVDSPRGKVLPPIFAHLGRFTSEFKTREKQSWWEPRFAPANKSIGDSLLAADDPRLLAAKAFKQTVDAGKAKVDFSKMEGGEKRGADGVPF